MKGKAVLTKEQILAANDLKRKEIPVPEWGGSVWVRELTAEEHDDWENSMAVLTGKGKDATVEANMANAKARLLVKCIIDEEGSRLFADADAASLGTKSAAVMMRLFDAAQELLTAKN